MIKEGIYWFLILNFLGIFSIFIGIRFLFFIFLILSLFVLYFFRNPDRKNGMIYDEDKIYSPADGKVFEIEKKDGKKIVKIFMNVLNCHVQRAPYKGKVLKTEHKNGKFLPAFKKEAEFENEQNLISIATERGEIEVKQIAGILARRISCFVREGDFLSTGDVLGMIKLGSQVDVSLPEEVKIRVKVGHKVFAGRTVIAEW